MEITDLARIVDGARFSVFRLETLAQYLVRRKLRSLPRGGPGAPLCYPPPRPVRGWPRWLPR